jgi:DNA repair protein RadC
VITELAAVMKAANLDLTRTLVKASHALNLSVHHHLIISRHGYFSLAEKNLL